METPVLYLASNSVNVRYRCRTRLQACLHFLDGPTPGLDGQSSIKVDYFLHEIAEVGQLIIYTTCSSVFGALTLAI